jgi:hypothetical protein
LGDVNEKEKEMLVVVSDLRFMEQRVGQDNRDRSLLRAIGIGGHGDPRDELAMS